MQLSPIHSFAPGPKLSESEKVWNPGYSLAAMASAKPSSDLLLRKGSCHCRAVRFEVLAPKVLHVYDCNCTICTKKQNRHFVVPKDRLKILQGEDNLTCYSFNKRQAKHLFCKTCGVQSFYVPRSNPDGYGVMPHCIDEGPMDDIVVETFDGRNWKQAIKDKPEIRERSKLQ